MVPCNVYYFKKFFRRLKSKNRKFWEKFEKFYLFKLLILSNSYESKKFVAFKNKEIILPSMFN